MTNEFPRNPSYKHPLRKGKLPRKRWSDQFVFMTLEQAFWLTRCNWWWWFIITCYSTLVMINLQRIEVYVFWFHTTKRELKKNCKFIKSKAWTKGCSLAAYDRKTDLNAYCDLHHAAWRVTHTRQDVGRPLVASTRRTVDRTGNSYRRHQETCCYTVKRATIKT